MPTVDLFEPRKLTITYGNEGYDPSDPLVRSLTDTVGVGSYISVFEGLIAYNVLSDKPVRLLKGEIGKCLAKERLQGGYSYTIAMASGIFRLGIGAITEHHGAIPFEIGAKIALVKRQMAGNKVKKGKKGRS